MGKVRVRHALITWMEHDEDLDREVVRMAMRDEVVDLPTKEETRLRKLDAVVNEDQQLERPGTLSELPQSPSDEEVLAWVRAASVEEVEALASDRPMLAARLQGALEAYGRAIQTDAETLQAALEAAKRGAETAEGGTPSAEGTTGDEDPDKVVGENVEYVTEYLSRHPEQANAILDAEIRTRGGKPRTTVVQAVEAASGSTQ